MNPSTITPADIKAARLLARWTQQHASEVAKVNIRTLQKWEREPSLRLSHTQNRFLASAKREATRLAKIQPVPAILRRQAA
jgi:DNA-binding transcriptional regulator YiaG